ncbi:MAG: GNAT family N-acetyltransferase [Deltaproteobacteria bacterium]|nr:GNAT family N-acetyltransferase [Deltaproteobacteria bacterium]
MPAGDGAAGAHAPVLRVRDVDAADSDAIRAVIKSAGNLTSDEEACAAELLDIYLNDADQRDYGFIAALDADGMVAGYACYGPRPLASGTYDLYWIIVAPLMRRYGVGRLLVQEVEGRLARLGARLIVAETSGLPEYESTRRFYLGCGFTEEARVKEFYKSGDDLIVYTKRL